jgi:hypothetical protein
VGRDGLARVWRKEWAGQLLLGDEGASCSVSQPWSAAAGRTTRAPCLRPPAQRIPSLGNKAERPLHSGCVEIFFFFPFRVSIGRIHHWEERKGEGYRSLKPKSHILFPEPRRIGGGVPNSLLLGRRLQHTALGSRSAQEVRLLPWRGESSAAGHDWFPGSWGVGGRRSHCSFGPGEKYWRGGGWFIL